MLSPDQLARILRLIPWLERADKPIIEAFRQNAFFATIPEGRDVFAPGDHVDAIALLLSGTVRVYKIGESGREITLYRFSAGESCILTASAVLNNEAFSAIASVETATEAVMIPASTFRDWVNRFPVWRDFVFDLLSQRLVSVITLVDEVAFGRLDVRVARLLLERAEVSQSISITHQEIAAELGSSREVISRILADFASRGLIGLGRGRIALHDSDAWEIYRVG